MLIGNAGKDPDVRHLESGVSTASFSLATTERYRDRNGEMKEQTEWHNIVCWRNLADVAERFVRKGTQLYIEGKIRTRSYSDKDNNLKYITEIVADSLQLLGKKPEIKFLILKPATSESVKIQTTPQLRDIRDIHRPHRSHRLPPEQLQHLKANLTYLK